MNILILTNELRYTCGVTNHLLHLSRGLSGVKGNRVWIICGGGNGIDRFDNIDTEIAVNRKFLHEERNLANYASAISYLAKFILRNKIDIVHSHTHYAANIARNASRITRTATVQTNHGLLEKKGILKHFNAGWYIAVNEHIRKFILEKKIAKDSRIKLIRCGIPVPGKIPVKDESRIKVIAASRFTFSKGLDLYIKAVSRLDKETKKKADFYLAGEGELKSELLKQNKETGANISYLGNVKDMYKILNTVHILVYPSRSTEEGYPAIITEAGANGMIVVTSDFRGAENIIENNINGFFFKSGDEASLTKKLEQVINKYEKNYPAAKQFYSEVKELFSLDKMIHKHMELYKECLR